MNKLYSRKHIVDFFAFFIILFIARMAFPYMVLLFSGYAVLFSAYLLYGVFSKNIIVDFRIKHFIKKWWSLLLIIFAILWAFLQTLLFNTGFFENIHFSSFIIKDFIHIIIYLFVAFVLTYVLSSQLSVSYLLYRLAFFMFVFSFLMAVIGLTKYILTIFNFDVTVFGSVITQRLITSVLRDYNYYAYTIILGLMGYVYLLYRKQHNKLASLSSLIIPLFTFCIIMSSSRRGFVFLVILLFVFLILTFKRFNKLQNVRRKLQSGLVSTIIVLSSFAIFVMIYSTLIKKESPDKIRLYEVRFLVSIEYTFDRYINLFTKERTFLNLYERPGRFPDWRDVDKKDKEDEPPAGTRKERFLYSVELFKEYNTVEKLLGKGFCYTTVFARHFYSPQKPLSHDYPHNFILSALLYSGIIGLLFLIIFLIHVIIALLYSGSHFKYLFSLLFLGAFFNLFSGNSIFSTPAFFLIFLFVLHTHFNITPKKPLASKK